jgi:hypothetical protein
VISIPGQHEAGAGAAAGAGSDAGSSSSKGTRGKRKIKGEVLANATRIAGEFHIALISEHVSRCKLDSLLAIDHLDPAGIKLNLAKINAVRACLLRGKTYHTTANCKLMPFSLGPAAICLQSCARSSLPRRAGSLLPARSLLLYSSTYSCRNRASSNGVRSNLVPSHSDIYSVSGLLSPEAGTDRHRLTRPDDLIRHPPTVWTRVDQPTNTRRHSRMTARGSHRRVSTRARVDQLTNTRGHSRMTA